MEVIFDWHPSLLSTLFECKDAKEVINKGYEKALLLVTKTIYKIMIGGQDLTQDDLIISKLLGQSLEKYRSLFPHVSAIQLSNGKDKHSSKGDTIEYIYTNSQHKNPLCRVVPIDSTYGYESEKLDYDKEKYKEMIVDAAETVLGYFGFDRTIYGNKKNKVTRKWQWLEELKQEREKDIEAEMMEN